jgi:hypothetical protein
MSRGKYANRSESASAREDAIRVAAERTQRAERLEGENLELRTRVAELEQDTARLITERVRELTADIDTARAEWATARATLAEAGECILSLYRGVITLSKGSGRGSSAALDVADGYASGFVVSGEWVPVSSVMLDIDAKTGNLLAVHKLPQHERRALKDADSIDRGIIAIRNKQMKKGSAADQRRAVTG